MEPNSDSRHCCPIDGPLSSSAIGAADASVCLTAGSCALGGTVLYPGETPRIITDNGPQFIAKDFKEFIRICGMTHVRTSPFYPQSNGKLERYHRTLKSKSIRPKTPLNVEDAKRVVGEFVQE